MTDKRTMIAGGLPILWLACIIVFPLLKLFDVIDWSWWWVFSPLIALIALIAYISWAFHTSNKS